MPRQIRFHAFGGPDVLTFEEVPERSLAAGEVRLAAQAVGVNFADVLYRENRYIEDAILPSGIGQEVAGIVTEVGPGVEGFAPGDRVVSFPSTNQSRHPSYGEMVIMPAVHLMPAPKTLTPIETAAVPVAYMTGYFAMFELAELASGQSVVITGASSSTGQAAIQMARAAGAKVIATTRSTAKRQALLDAGAGEVIVSNDEDVAGRVLELTGGKGADLIYDGVGGEQLAALGDAVARRGWYVLYGLSGGAEFSFPVLSAFRNSWRFHVFKVSEYSGGAGMGLPQQLDALERAKRYIHDGVEAGWLKPRVDRVFPLEEAAAAHAYMDQGGHIGKIVLEVSQ